MKSLKRILIVRTDRIGDVLLSTPVIKALREVYPESRIAFMLRPYAREIAEGNPYLDEVIVYDKYGKDRGIYAGLRFAHFLKKKRFDAAFILHPTNRVHLITFLARIPIRVGYDKKMSFLLTDRIKDSKHLGQKHEAEYNFDVLKAVGIKKMSDELFMPRFTRDKEKVEAILIEKGIKAGDKIVAVHPAASCPSKIWPPERFAKVCDALVRNDSCKIVFICSDKDNEICRQVVSFMSEAAYAVFEGLKLKELAALLEKARLLISNDSGPVHIAVAVSTPVIDIFGRNQTGLSPRRWGPLDKKSIVLHKEVGCRDCLAHKCDKNFKCLKAIKVEDVLDAAKKIEESISS